MKHWVEHAVRPLNPAVRELIHAFYDGVAVALAVTEDGEYQRRGGCRDQVFADVYFGRHDGIQRGGR